MNKLSYIFYLLLVSLFLLGSCNKKTSYELRKKVVLKKTIINDEFKIAFTDGSDCDVNYGVYENAEKGDTIIFKYVDGLSFNVWNCEFVEVIKKN
jgi:hypothetical protein